MKCMCCGTTPIPLRTCYPEDNIAEEARMTICPIALATGCKKCALFKVCPAKGIIGDYKPEPPKDDSASKPKG